MPEYTIRISNEAEEMLQRGILEWTAGGLRNTKTKRMAYLFRPTGNRIDEETGKIIIETVVGAGMEEDAGLPAGFKRQLTKVLDRIEKCEQLSWEAVLIAEKTYDAVVKGFKDVLDRIDKLQETVDYYHRQGLEQEFREAVLNLKMIYCELVNRTSDDKLFDMAKDLNKVDALLNKLFGEFTDSGNHSTYLVRMILILAILFSTCVEEYRSLSHFIGKGEPPAAVDWEATIEKIWSSEELRNCCRKMTYMALPDAATSEIEYTAKLPIRHLEILKEDSRNRIVLIDSGLNQANGYTSVGEALMRLGIAGNYTTGNMLYEHRYG